MNTAGSFLLGLVTFLGMGNDLVLFFGTDVAGPFTTFSSFSVETVRLWETGDRFRVVENAAGTLVGALLALGAAWILARALGHAVWGQFPRCHPGSKNRGTIRGVPERLMARPL